MILLWALVVRQQIIILCYGTQLYLGKQNLFELKRIFEFCCILMFRFFNKNKNKNNKSPHDTPFEDGTFKLTLVFTEEYPNKPPIVRFVSKMFHPNGKKLFYHLEKLK